MSDLLEAAKKALPGLRWKAYRNGVDAHSQRGNFFGHFSTEAEICEQRRQMVANRDALDAALGQGWTPVSERLPHHNDEVLLWNSGSVLLGRLANRSGTEWVWTDLDGNTEILRELAVTHWRSIPAAPEVK